MDMAIVILSIVGIVIEDAASSDSKLPINPTIVRFMRVLRIARGKKNRKQEKKCTKKIIEFLSIAHSTSKNLCF